jgi:AcrR family transcriptional regulator
MRERLPDVLEAVLSDGAPKHRWPIVLDERAQGVSLLAHHLDRRADRPRALRVDPFRPRRHRHRRRRPGRDLTKPFQRPVGDRHRDLRGERAPLRTFLPVQAVAYVSSICFNRCMESVRVDQRREAGLRTRTRLMDAALDLLAERGEDGVSLRELTGAAQANVAAVSYHFGSLKSLCDAAVEYALERYLAAQREAVGALGAEASLEELAAAFAQPMMRALAVGGRDLDVIRIVARAGIDPPKGWARFDASFDRIRAGVLRVLKANVPGVKTQDLIFRTRCAAGLLNWLVLAPVGDELRNRSEKQIARVLVPLLAGAFRGTTSA